MVAGTRPQNPAHVPFAAPYRSAMTSDKPRIAVTMGDPGGIGPEVLAKSLSDPGLRSRAHFRLYGPAAALQSAAAAAGVGSFWTTINHDSPTVGPGVLLLDYPAAGPFAHEPNRAGGEMSFKLVEDAIIDARRTGDDARHIDAVVTGPISKLAWKMAGKGQYPGHTELFATRSGAKRFGMLFVSPRLRVMLATVHLPLMDIRSVLTVQKVLDAIELSNDAVKKLGVLTPRVAVCGLNPHAGEDGLLGDEESRIMERAIDTARHQGIADRG